MVPGDASRSITVERIDAWNRVAEIGYWLGKEFVGKGIMRRSAAALIDYLIEKRAINRIEIRCTPANVSSQAIPLSLGFRMEGTLREAAYLKGRFHDHLLFAITAEEWKRRKQGEEETHVSRPAARRNSPEDKKGHLAVASNRRKPQSPGIGGVFSSRIRAAKHRFLRR